MFYGLRTKRVAIASLLWTITSIWCVQAVAQKVARRGVLDLRNVQLSQRPIELRGEWKWYWRQLRTQNSTETAFEYTAFPQLWSASRWQGRPVGSQGYATYSLTVLLPPHKAPLMLELPDQYSAYRLFVNGRELAHDGNPATTRAETIPYWSTQLAELPVADTLRLVLQIANFHHAKGGSTQPIRLGLASELRLAQDDDRALDLFLVGCLFMSGLFLLGLFSFSKTDRAILYFGLFCLTYSYRIIGTDLYVLHTLLPAIPWQVTVRLEYLSLYASVGLFVAYTQLLYPWETHPRLVRLMIGLCAAFAVTVVLPARWFTQLINPFLFLMLGYIGYACYVYWMAARRRRPGAMYSLISTALLMLVFGLIILQYVGLTIPATALLFAGYLIFFFLQSLVLSFRYAYELGEARKIEKQFLANMSHEIRTPLNAILGFSNLLQTTKLTEEQEEFLRYIRTAGNNLLTVVNDILDFTKIEAGLLPLESVPFSVQALIDSLQTMLMPAADDKNLKLSVEVDPTLPPVLLGDPTRLTQILLNLMSNAIKFTRKGSVTVRANKLEQTSDTVQVQLMVEDTGVGIDADALPHIFERFKQANDSTTRFYGGTGLGLSIVKSLTELQGGTVSVTSTADEGSCFIVTIGYRIAPNEGELATDQTVSAWVQTEKVAGRLLRVLVVEDNPMNQKLALGVLNRLGHMAKVAENGQVALDLLEHYDFDLVLMDIQMPVMDGFTTTFSIRNKMHSSVPIIAMTAHALASEREKCLQAGMNDFLPKPFRPQDLQQMIRKHVPAASKPPAPAPAPIPEPIPAPPPSPQTDFSIEPLVKAVGDDTDLAHELLDLFLQQTPDQNEEIRQALVNSDRATVKAVIHSQKASIKMLGLTESTQQIQEIEALLQAQAELSDIAPLVRAYLTLLDTKLVAIRSFVESKP
ncbi:response regulator [Spirosoma montaniterrae]|uniref:histidine kinase n=1 Tax=Spirosoma montaniterrae TaxID=1178516 RepID=A0A1P9X000_9BACT|nr:response regulator [Spirosoma montaniterrae]AQG80944.1 hypothetical protein AWR27_17410 [Spirosoma montaniterrae]